MCVAGWESMSLLSKLVLEIVVVVSLGLHCCTWAFSSCSKRGLLFIAGHRLLTAVASLIGTYRLWVHGLQ